MGSSSVLESSVGEAWRRQQAAPIPTHIESLQGSVPAQEAGFVREQDPWAREQDRPQA